jgi:hypothetical protein
MFIIVAWAMAPDPAASFEFSPTSFGERTAERASDRVPADAPARSGIALLLGGIAFAALGTVLVAKVRYASSSATAPGQSATGFASRPSARSGLPPPRPPSLAASCFHSAAQSSAEPAARTSSTVPTSGA